MNGIPEKTPAPKSRQPVAPPRRPPPRPPSGPAAELGHSAGVTAGGVRYLIVIGLMAAVTIAVLAVGVYLSLQRSDSGATATTGTGELSARTDTASSPHASVVPPSLPTAPTVPVDGAETKRDQAARPQPAEPTAKTVEIIPPEEKPEGHGPLADVRRRNRILPIPKAKGRSGSADLAQILAPPRDCQLTLRGMSDVLDAKRTFRLEVSDKADGSRTWAVQGRMDAGMGRPQLVGSFVLKDQALGFRWDPTIKNGSPWEKLRYCVLDVTVKNESETCVLIEPLDCESARVKLLDKTVTDDLTISIPGDETSSLARPDLLRLDLRLNGFPPHELVELDTSREVSGRGLVANAKKRNNGGTPPKTSKPKAPKPRNEAKETRAAENSGVRARFSDPQVDEEAPLLELNMAFVLKDDTSPELKIEPRVYAFLLNDDGTLSRTHGPCNKALVEQMQTRDLKKELESRLARAEAARTDCRNELREAKQKLASASQSVHSAHQRLMTDPESKPDIKDKEDSLKLKEAASSSVETLQAFLETRDAEVAAVSASLKDVDRYRKWCERVSQLMDDLPRDGQIEFRLYAAVDHAEVELVRSRGYYQKQAD